MKTTNVNKIKGISFTGGKSYRAVLKKDDMGFAMMKTVVDMGGPYKWHYKNHKEACMCISGYGMIEDLKSNTKHAIEPGVTYLIDENQPHLFTAYTDIVLVSVFNPPLRGDETHDENGNYI